MDKGLASIEPRPASQLADSVKFALVQQGIVLVLTAMILDGGEFGLKCLFGLIAFWVVTIWICLSRKGNLTRIDMAIIRGGSLVACALSYLVTTWIWRMRGYQ